MRQTNDCGMQYALFSTNVDGGFAVPRIALPDWNGRISPVFDSARHLLVVDADQGQETNRFREECAETLLPRRVHRLVELGVDVLICGGISNPLRSMAEAAGITVLPWQGGEVDEVLSAYLAGSLSGGTYSMPGRGAGKGPRYRGGRTQ
jgi:predicted Fe-Mo cluster-binding NifX family protein